ncbi:exodeoxyribonuclease VII small subunit [Acetobacter sp. AN02]|uniref:exodeoxyribonuclease VII small subunit n=1 Tax=Acetobacter sp. AN02 TaxID=2894186 RepID=UPI002434450E|nr:exodeoxyribonuclease VII small subunit [Acetobacter sp. AN02]MDG6095498.1 exodeoxyribonuclease VII small subunit [Acetobacter sp. AN02]
MNSDITALSFEEALHELERIVRSMEVGQLKLEDAITAYERGSVLRQHCEKKLREAEERVQLIVKKNDGSAGVANLEQT